MGADQSDLQGCPGGDCRSQPHKFAGKWGRDKDSHIKFYSTGHEWVDATKGPLLTATGDQLHFIWLNKTTQPNRELMFPSEHAASLQAWTDVGAPRWSAISLWFDTASVTDSQVAATARRFPTLRLMDAALLPEFVALDTLPRTFDAIPLFFRVDFLKLLIQLEVLQRGAAGSVHVITDIDVDPRGPDVFNPFVRMRLHKFGVLFAWKEWGEANEIENGWCVSADASGVETADLTRTFLQGALALARLRLQHSTDAAAVSGCVYQGIVQMAAWMSTQVTSDGVREPRLAIRESKDVMRFVPPASLPDAATIDWSPYGLHGNSDTAFQFSGLDIFIFGLFEMEEAGINKGDGTIVTRPILLQKVVNYFDMPTDTVPVMFISIGSTKGADSWVAADASGTEAAHASPESVPPA